MRKQTAQPIIKVLVYVIALVAIIALPFSVKASTYFVYETSAGSHVMLQDAQDATSLIREMVVIQEADELAESEDKADFVLRPRLLKLSDSLLLTLEKASKSETLFVVQSKIQSRSLFKQSVTTAALAAIEGPRSERQPSGEFDAAPYQAYDLADSEAALEQEGDSISGTSSEGASSEEIHDNTSPGALAIDKQHYWTIGMGPTVATHLGSDRLLFQLMAGHEWNLTSRFAAKVFGDYGASIRSGGPRIFSFGLGTTYFIPVTKQKGPYLCADVGYGQAVAGDDEGEGKSRGAALGGGLGFQFYRLNEATLDVGLRYAVILDRVSTTGRTPSTLGLRMAVNF